MSANNRKSWMGRRLLPLLLALVVLAPYHRLLVGAAIPIPDDGFVSDLADGDLPVRVEVGRLLRSGELPLWVPGIGTGSPIQALEPVAVALFTALPPALALGWYVSFWILTAALGTYALARQIGANRAGSFLAGVAFAWSGFMVCQLRHTAILAVVSLFPAALLCLERAAGGALEAAGARDLPLRMRLRWFAGFAAVLGLQLLAAFPQSTYNAVLVYAALVAARCAWLLAPSCSGSATRARAAAAGFAAGSLAAVAVAILVGMAQLLPLSELASLSDRSGGGTFAWATKYSYWPRNALTFLLPYANGDISDLSYSRHSIFWEDYGYVGLTTLCLALLAVVLRYRRFAVLFWGAAGLIAYALVLGPATPLFGIAFSVVPGLSGFRFPTRFLFIVELALALLGGLGLTAFSELLVRRLPARARQSVPRLVAVAFVIVTAADLIYHHRRQNPLVEAETWLRTPASAAAIRAADPQGRVFSPGSRELHAKVFERARGWSGDLTPYIEHRDILQPNANLLHGVATLDGYTGLGPRWTVDLIGDHNRIGLLPHLYALEQDHLQATPAFFDLLESFSVGWLILPFRSPSGRIEHVASVGSAELYRLPGVLPRARVVEQAMIVGSAADVGALLESRLLDLRRGIVLHDPAAAALIAENARAASLPGEPGAARIIDDRATRVTVEAVAPRGGFLLLADTWYPGWEATVDGLPAQIFRANVMSRAVPLPPGRHRVSFVFRPRSVAIGFALSAIGIAVLLGTAVRLARRENRG